MQKFFLASFFAMLISTSYAQGITRDELKRADLTGKDMDVSSLSSRSHLGKIFRNTFTPGKKPFTCSKARPLSSRTEARGNFPLERPQSIIVTYLTPASRLQATRH